MPTLGLVPKDTSAVLDLTIAEESSEEDGGGVSSSSQKRVVSSSLISQTQTQSQSHSQEGEEHDGPQHYLSLSNGQSIDQGTFNGSRSPYFDQAPSSKTNNDLGGPMTNGSNVSIPPPSTTATVGVVASNGASTASFAASITQSSQPSSPEASPVTSSAPLRDANAHQTPNHSRITAHSPTTAMSAMSTMSATSANLTASNNTNNASHLTRVDGKGLWRSWKRNFNTKLLALLDLIDNSLDASIKGMESEDDPNFIGRVHVYPDVYSANNVNNNANNVDPSNPSSAPYTPTTLTTTGMCIVNNCLRPIRPLEKVLEVYNSSKIDSGAGDIGENGVGLKQGCATLSDLSFVLVKNGGNDRIELGIIAESLQRLGGCYLPAFQFRHNRGNTGPSLKDQMTTLFSKPEHADVAQCIARYGALTTDSQPNLQVGIHRLCSHFNKLCFDFWGNPYVFSLILDKLRHGQSDGSNDKTSRAVDIEQKIRVVNLMQELKTGMPRTYLHIPDSFDFTIRFGPPGVDSSVVFKYWPERLVEFSSFKVQVGTAVPWHVNFGARDDSPGTYELRVFLGFDVWRISEKEAKKEASLYVYSRQSGRLINYVPDARTLLGLSAGGTTFCSGLTIIIDDIGGHLPLNPTKQEIAFGEQACGEIHKENLYKWVGAVTNFYYNQHLKKYDDKRTILTREIGRFMPQILQLQQENSNSSRELRTCDNSKLTTYDVEWKQMGKKMIRVDWKSVKEIVGPDTRFRLPDRSIRRQNSSVEPHTLVAPAQPNQPVVAPVQSHHPVALGPVPSHHPVSVALIPSHPSVAGAHHPVAAAQQHHHQPIAPTHPNILSASLCAADAPAVAVHVSSSLLAADAPLAQEEGTSSTPQKSPSRRKRKKSADSPHGLMPEEVGSVAHSDRAKRKRAEVSYRESEARSSSRSRSSSSHRSVLASVGADPPTPVRSRPPAPASSGLQEGNADGAEDVISIDDSKNGDNATTPVSNEEEEDPDQLGQEAQADIYKELCIRLTMQNKDLKKENKKLLKENKELKKVELISLEQSKRIISRRDEQIRQLKKDNASLEEELKKLRDGEA